MRQEKEQKKSNRTILKLIIVIILIGMATFILRIAPNYIKDEDENAVKLVINYQDVTKFLKANIYKSDSGIFYLSKEDIANFYDKYIYYDEKYNQIVTTSDDKILVMGLDSYEKEVNGEKKKANGKIIEMNGKYYIPVSELEDIYNINFNYIEETNTVVLESINKELKQAESVKDNSVKYKSTIFSKTIEKIEEGETLTIVPLTEEQEKLVTDGWIKVRTKKGKLGYVKKDSIKNEKIVREAKIQEKQVQGKVSLVWEYFSEYATAPDRTATSIDGVNVVSPSFFYLEKSGKGKLLENVGKSGINYINWAHSNGYKVWPIVSNNSMKETTSEIMNDYELRNKLINQIVSYVNEYNLDGVNIDFEYMKEEDKKMFSRFIIELTPRMKAVGKVVSVDVTAPDGSPDWSLCFDRNTLGKVADYIMFMAYDQNGASSPKEGTTAGYDWVKLNISKFINQEEVQKEKLVLGMPFYTRLWKEKDGKTTSTVVLMKNIESVIPSDTKKEWDDILKQNYVQYEKDGAIYKMWLEDEKSINEKLSLIKDFNLAGGCYWAKDFEKQEIWTTIKKAIE